MKEHAEQWLERQPAEIQKLLENGVILYPEFDAAIMGVVLPSSAGGLTFPVIAYDMDKIKAMLIADATREPDDTDQTIEEMIVEHIEFNIIGGWLGEFTPLHVWPKDNISFEDEDSECPADMVGVGYRCSQDAVAVFNEGTEGAAAMLLEERLEPVHVRKIEEAPIGGN